MLRYVPALDGLRALAVVLVFLFHSSYVTGGWVGVDVFFVLSGYLITSILLTEHERTGVISLRHFYIRRACRLLPALVVVVGVVAGMAVCFQNKVKDTEIDAVKAFFYLLDYHYAFMSPSAYHDTPLTHLWSLSVEEQFYFLWPLLLIVLLNKGNRRVALVATLLLIVVIVGWRIFLVVTRPDPSFRIYFAFDTRADELLIGCVLALWRSRVLIARFLKSISLFAASLLAVVVVKISNFEPITSISYPLFGASAGCFILMVTSGESAFLTRLLSVPPIVALGRISYGFYLWHLPIIMVIKDHFIMRRMVLAILAFSVTLAVATGSYWLIERPFLRLKFWRFSSVSSISSSTPLARPTLQ